FSPLRPTLQTAAVAAGLLALALAACNSTSGTTPPMNTAGGGYTAAQQSAVDSGGSSTYVLPQNVQRACPQSMSEDYAQCYVQFRTDNMGPDVNGWGAPDLQSAYNLPSSTKGSGQTVAIVDAYDQPNVESDLAMYRSNFGLPACGSSNGCFQKVN